MPVRRRYAALGVALGTVLAVAVGTAGGATSPESVDWAAWGNSPEQTRHTPLTQIGKDNVDKLGRLYTVDFRQIDPSIRRGTQSYPLAIGGRLYVTTNDDNVFALNAVTGDVIWRWKPDNVAIFRNFGIAASRGVAYCQGRLYLATLDMYLVALNARTGKLVKRVPISAAVPRATPSYGYSETSPPVCADGRVVVGAAGSEYGVRGFVMAYTPDLEPAWPNPFWTIPPEGTSWRRLSRIVGGGVSWTPQTIDPSTHTLYFGTGSATPLYFPQFRPGQNPRTDSLIAVDLRNGRMKWWQQQMPFNEWSYDTAQPPLVYDGKVGGKTRRIVSVATMEGLWFAYDAATGAPIHQRVKVIDRTEHPRLQPGKPVPVYPGSIGGLNFSPASYDPKTNYVVNAAAETASLMIQARLTPTQKKRKLTQGDVFLGLENGNFGSFLPGWHDHGSISAIDVSTGRRVWKFTTPEPERGGVTTTASGLGFAGGGDGVLRAFDTKTGKVLWTFQTGHQIAAGPTIFSVGGKEYLAISSGGTPTSSGGGNASELQVFTLGAAQKASPPPQLASRSPGSSAGAERTLAASSRRVQRAAALSLKAVPRKTRLGVARIATQSGLVVRGWTASSQNTQVVGGRVFLGRTPVQGARVAVEGYAIPSRTAADGSFRYPVDITVPQRPGATVGSASRARANGRPLTKAEQRALVGVQAGFDVGYRIADLRAARRANGTIGVSGRLVSAEGGLPPAVALYTYRLTGVITDAAGKPVPGAVVVTRTRDRDFWTFSSRSDSLGRYTSFFAASDETAADPVVMAVQVAVGNDSYGLPTGVEVPFDRLHSARMNIQLPPSGTGLPAPKPASYAGAVYEGILVGVAGPGVVKPVSARWPDRTGRFSFVLPASMRGKTVRLWESFQQLFQTSPTGAGGPIDLQAWPRDLAPSVPRNLATLRLPG
jgi:PQQ-dependent dehydrogenase (methanol/ethanol family)